MKNEYSLWHPISDGLPPVGMPLIVTIKDHLQGGFPRQIRTNVYYVKDAQTGHYHFKWLYGDLCYDLLIDVSEVVAWMEMPKIWEGEEDENNY